LYPRKLQLLKFFETEINPLFLSALYRNSLSKICRQGGDPPRRIHKKKYKKPQRAKNKHELLM